MASSRRGRSGFGRYCLRGSFRLCGFCCLRFPAAFLGGLLATLRLLVAGVVGLHELDQRKFGGVTLALRAQLVDAGVTAIAVREFLVGFVEQLGDRGFVADIRQGETTQMDSVLLLGFRRGLLGFGDNPLDERTKGLGLCKGGLDATVRDKRRGEVG